MVNRDRFPDLKQMTDYGHAHGMRMGWYLNLCLCQERDGHGPGSEADVIRGDVRALTDFGFDGVKLDHCSQYNDIEQWTREITATGRARRAQNEAQDEFTTQETLLLEPPLPCGVRWFLLRW